MSFLFEVHYKPPIDSRREMVLADSVQTLGGRFSFREDAVHGHSGICLTFEFDDRHVAEKAAELLRSRGEHIEGPGDYGN